MLKLANNLTNLMKKYGIGSSELSRRTGVGQAVINRIMNGVTTNPNVGTLAPIAAYFSINISELIGGLNDSCKIFLPNTEGGKKIPVFSWKKTKNWSLETKKSKKKHKYILVNKGVTQTAFALIIEEDLDARFPKNSILIIEPEKKPKNRDYILVLTKRSDIATLKHLIIDGDIQYLKPIDPSLSATKINNEYEVLGVVVQLIFDFY